MQKILNTLIKIPAPSGYEGQFGMIDELERIVQKQSWKIGNNLVYKFGTKGKKILITAHIDEVGFFVVRTSCDYRALPIGSIEMQSFQELIPIDIFDLETNSRTEGIIKPDGTIKISKNTIVSQASLAVFKKEIFWNQDIITAPSLDNKTGVTALLDVVRELSSKNTFEDYQIFCAFVASEEQNMNGVMQAVREIYPDFCIDIDSAYAKPYENESARSWIIPEIGKGPALQLMGKGWILRDKVRMYISKTAQFNKLNFQFELPSGDEGGTNAISFVNAGLPFCQINIPVANQHTNKSKASINDIIAVKPFVFSILKNISDLL